ncbi:MAG: hypothetical protein N3B18_06455 [Desulfobacterota bacterium]|nr:hypothetical protein [Thermodesulfobacteriota bacterium]
MHTHDIRVSVCLCSMLFCLGFLLLASCAPDADRIRITAEITTVYNEHYVLDDFAFVYWWQERGETPFLKPYTMKTTDFIVVTVNPVPDQPNRVFVDTKHIPLADIDYINITLTDTGKKIVISQRNGTIIEAIPDFPRALRKDQKSGIADHKLYIEGRLLDGNGKTHRQEFDYITRITVRAIQQMR